MAKKTKTYVDENPKTMMLVKSAFGNMKSFKLLPMFAVNPEAFDLNEFFLSDSELVGADTEKDSGIIIV